MRRPARRRRTAEELLDVLERAGERVALSWRQILQERPEPLDEKAVRGTKDAAPG